MKHDLLLIPYDLNQHINALLSINQGIIVILMVNYYLFCKIGIEKIKSEKVVLSILISYCVFIYILLNIIVSFDVMSDILKYTETNFLMYNNSFLKSCTFAPIAIIVISMVIFSVSILKLLLNFIGKKSILFIILYIIGAYLTYHIAKLELISLLYFSGCYENIACMHNIFVNYGLLAEKQNISLIGQIYGPQHIFEMYETLRPVLVEQIWKGTTMETVQKIPNVLLMDIHQQVKSTMYLTDLNNDILLKVFPKYYMDQTVFCYHDQLHSNSIRAIASFLHSHEA